MKVKMSFSPLVCYFLLFIFLDVAVKSQMSSHSNSNAFLQTDSDVRYIVDSIPMSMHKDFSSNSGVKVQNEDESTNFNSKAHLKFEPLLLDFKERYLGVPHHEKVTIINLNPNKTVHMSSISGNTVHFHSSFFEDKLIPPLGNTSFNVVFLGREEGEIESNLFIHTSEGSFKYQVKGSSIQSPYRLRPLSGVRLPLNASFAPLIQMHNPYPIPIQLIEVYSSGGEFHLELPSGELEGPRHMWEIPAFLTKPIIRVRFHARAQKNHTAYIRLKVNRSEEVLVVPLEVEVGAVCGLYSPEDIIDFGIGGSHDPPSTVKLWLHNSWKKPIKIHNVISTPVSKALKIDFQPVKVPPESEEPTNVALLTFDWGLALETGHTSGRVVVKSKQSTQKLVIPYTATVLAGGLSYDSMVTRFRSDSANNPPRMFQLTNNYRLPIAITNVSLTLEAQSYFQLRQFEPCILQPGQSAPLFQIIPRISRHLTLDSTIIVHTNVSTLSIPLLCYDGKLIKVISFHNESEIELGTVGSGMEKQVVFALVNENPVPVTLLSWDTSLPSTIISIAAVRDGNATTFLSQYYLYNDTTKERTVGPGQYAVVRITVQAATQVGESQGHVTLGTEYETIKIAAHMRVEHGSLQVTPDPIIFEHCFPGKVCTEELRVQSLFSVAMAVTGVSGVGAPADTSLSFSPAAPPLLPPAATTHLGTLSFDTQLLPPEDNYLATMHNVTGATRWQDTLELPAHCPDYDLSLLAARYDHYRNLSSHLLNLSLRLDTTEVREHFFGAKVRLSWPRLARDLVFPLTQVGNTTQRSLLVSNPGTQQPLVVQLVLENTYPSVASVLENLPPRLRPEVLTGAQSILGEFVVDVVDSQYRTSGSHIHRDTWVFMIPPASNTTVRVCFTPSGAHLASTLLLLRNNLTVLDAVQLSGSGAFTQFKFGNRKPGSSTPLLFELAEKHLKDCEREKQRKFPAPNLTVKRSFTARNTGALPIIVHGFHISGLPCEGYGFRVLNCEAFQLLPNTTRKVDIAFTPDFTLARIQRTLGVWTSESDIAANYTLVATLPPFLLSTCSSVLARPPWEPLLYYCAITFMVFLLVCVLAAAFLESDRALKCALLAMSRDNVTVQPVLDLKSIGTGVGICPTNSSGSISSSSSGGSNCSVLSSSHSSTEPPTVPWTRTTAAAIPNSHMLPHESEVTKEKVKPEIESPNQVKGTLIKKRDKERVSKRYSDPTDNVSTERRSSWANVFTKPVTSQVSKPQTKVSVATPPLSPSEPIKISALEGKKKISKRNSNSGKCIREKETSLLPVTSLSLNVGEDTETSSTTTDSSHDDGDKEVEVTMASGDNAGKGQRNRSKATEVKKSPSAAAERNGGSASSIEPEWDEEEREVQAKKSHNARPRKSNIKIGKAADIGHNNSRTKNSNGANKQNNLRTKEKQTLTQKRISDKLPCLPKPVVFEPPPPPLSLWDESRASFSDVVARSDATKHTPADTPTSLHSIPSPQIASTPPTPPILLGPIGSKKSYPSVWSYWGESSELATTPTCPTSAPPTAPVSSFFMGNRPTTTHPQNTSYDGWTEPNLILKMLQGEGQRRMEAEEFQRRSVYQEAWSPWEPICSGASTADSTTTPTQPSLWGSDVWAPPPPDTWAPPGLAPRPPPQPANSELDIGLDYDPFRSLSNIWAPQTPHFWKPPTTTNN